eukprot:scaffold594_cov116-Isochrysis_galbana.AAC.5
MRCMSTCPLQNCFCCSGGTPPPRCLWFVRFPDYQPSAPGIRGGEPAPDSPSRSRFISAPVFCPGPK